MTRVHWIAASQPPEWADDRTYLVAVSDNALESFGGPHCEVLPATWDGRAWRDVELAEDITTAVTHWCQLPGRPQ